MSLAFHAIPSKIFVGNRNQTHCEGGALDNMSFCTGCSIEFQSWLFLMNWPFNSLPCSMRVVLPDMRFMCSSGNFMQFLGIFYKVTPHYTHEGGGLWTWVICTDLDISFNSWHNSFRKRTHTSQEWRIWNHCLQIWTYNVISSTCFVKWSLHSHFHLRRGRGWQTWLFCANLDVSFSS